jgi:GTP cyclohydrolase II
LAAQVDIPIGPRGDLAKFLTFDGLSDDADHFALLFKGSGATPDTPLVRIHSECVTGDVFASGRCDCGAQLREAIDRLSEEGGCLIYLRQEGRGIGLKAKIAAYVLQEKGLDTFSANVALGFPEDGRSFLPAAQMLLAMNIHCIRLITNNPSKIEQLSEFGINISSIESTGVFATSNNIRYLISKSKLAHHNIKLPDGA